MTPDSAAAVDLLAQADADLAEGREPRALAALSGWLHAHPEADPVVRAHIIHTATDAALALGEVQQAESLLAAPEWEHLDAEVQVRAQAEYLLRAGRAEELHPLLAALPDTPATALMRCEYLAAVGQWTEALRAANALLAAGLDEEVRLLERMHHWAGHYGDTAVADAIRQRLAEIAPWHRVV